MIALSELLLLVLLREENHAEFSGHPSLGEAKQFMFGSADDGSADTEKMRTRLRLSCEPGSFKNQSKTFP